MKRRRTVSSSSDGTTPAWPEQVIGGKSVRLLKNHIQALRGWLRLAAAAYLGREATRGFRSSDIFLNIPRLSPHR